MTFFDWAVALGGGVVMVMSARYIRAGRRKHSPGTSFNEALVEIGRQEQSPQAQLTRLEVRAYDQFRVLEARLENRMAILDQLNQEAAEHELRLRYLIERAEAAAIGSNFASGKSEHGSGPTGSRIDTPIAGDNPGTRRVA